MSNTIIDTFEKSVYRGGDHEAEYVCSVADALVPGDEILVNDRSRPVTVESRHVQNGPMMVSPEYPYKIVVLSGNGTTYHLRYSHTGECRPQLFSEAEINERIHLGEEQTTYSGDSERVYRVTLSETDSKSELTEIIFSRMAQLDDPPSKIN